MSKLEVFVLAIVGVNLIVAIELVRRRRLHEDYAVLWIGVGLAGIAVALGRSVVDRISQQVGISYGANLVLTLGILLLLFICMSLSVHISRLEARTEVLAEEVAFLRGVRAPEPRGSDEPV